VLVDDHAADGELGPLAVSAESPSRSVSARAPAMRRSGVRVSRFSVGTVPSLAGVLMVNANVALRPRADDHIPAPYPLRYRSQPSTRRRPLTAPSAPSIRDMLHAHAPRWSLETPSSESCIEVRSAAGAGVLRSCSAMRAIARLTSQWLRATMLRASSGCRRQTPLTSTMMSRGMKDSSAPKPSMSASTPHRVSAASRRVTRPITLDGNP